MNGKLMKCMKELVFEMGTVWNCEFIKWCIYGHCLCNLTVTEPKESILKDCLSHKKTFCSGYKMINQGGQCNKTLCMDALLKCKDSENSDTTTYYDQTTNADNRDVEDMQEYLCQGETLNIACPNNFVIVFKDANFGRGKSDKERCSHWKGLEIFPCDHQEQTLKFLNNKCKGQQQCFLPVNKDTFGTPCRGITKYLYVEYYCKRKVHRDSENVDISSNIDHTTYDGTERMMDRITEKESGTEKTEKTTAQNLVISSRSFTKQFHRIHLFTIKVLRDTSVDKCGLAPDSRNSDTTTDSDQTALNGNENENDRGDRRKHRWDRKDRRKKQDFENGAIVGISVGITCTLILCVVIVLVIYVCRRRSKKKKRKQQTRIQAIDQSGPSCSNKEQYTIPSTNKPLNTDKAQGEYFVLDPSFTKYDKDLSNRKLPEIKRCSGADGDDNVYYEIDEDNINSSSDMEGVHQKKIEVMDQGSHPNDLTINHTQLGSMEKNTEQLTRQQLVDQGYEMSNFEINHSGTNQEGTTILSENKLLTTDEAQGDYFVLDPSVTKYDKDMVIPEVNITSAAQGVETVYNEIDEDPIEPSTVIKVDHQKQMEEATDIAIYHTELTNNQNQLGFDNTTYSVTSEVDDIIF
ncbi:unnamed protein product [Mytilus edulis]|uniref:SUEL-type lectin domain-containing protein n=1 Tax=Mytilus edulis TaxID=6550 RepID=A0A8S3URX8_MYTED|nr:unnamed protein product [Mytilus edulis]